MHVIFRTVKAKAETMTLCVLGVAVVLQVSNPRNGHNKICFVSSNKQIYEIFHRVLALYLYSLRSFTCTSKSLDSGIRRIIAET